MRICILSKFIPPTSTDGIPRTRWEYARQFTALGHEVHIITSGFKGTERIEHGIHIHEIAAWDQGVFSRMFTSSVSDETCRHLLCYSYLVYKRVKRLNDLFPIDIIESPLWDIEGYITRLRLPFIAMVVRLETTSLLLREILKETKQYKNLLNEIETHFMQLATGFVFDSWSILKETERLYKFNFNKQPYCVIHHGITSSNISVQPEASLENKQPVKVLIAGRLEKRKGSDILVKNVLPNIFDSGENLEFHIVGKDSAEWDGFKEKEGLTYHEYIRKNFKKYIDKRIFLYGYVTDEWLDRLYSESDIVLALSKYESFGLLYLEAMGKAKPLIVLRTGAVPEIFENGKDAIVIDPTTPEKIAPAIRELKDNPSKRRELALNALKKLRKNFSAQEMGKKCADFFEELAFGKLEQRVFQVMNCLTDRDGVSNTTIDYDVLLKENGVNTQIIGTWATPPVQHLSTPIDQVEFKQNDYVIYHYWNYCEKGPFFNQLNGCLKIFFFHNITTPNFFKKDDESYYATSKGFEQLSIFDNFDLYVCHTQYSANILRQSINKPINTFILPPVIDKEAVLARPYDHHIIEQKKGFTFLFVGSIAPHKKQTDLVRFFEYYSKKFDQKARLLIVGGGSASYITELQSLVRTLKITENVIITGKVPDEQLYAFYRIADVFLSMSEHEGFGVPLAEAMCFEIPVVAYRSTAVPETIAENGCLFEEKDFEFVASLVEKTKIVEFRNNVVQRQNRRLADYSKQAIFNAFVKLKQLAHTHRKKERPKKLGEKRMDDVVMYDDKRLMKHGAVKITDDHLLMIDGNKGQSFVTLEDYFQDIEFLFLATPWSGKINICIDVDLQQEFDLYSPQREMKKLTLSRSFNPGHHKLTISTTDKKSQFALSNEIFLEKIILKKLFTFEPIVEGFTNVDGSESGISRNDENDVLIENLIEDESESSDSRTKYLTIIQEVSALDSAISYYNDWLVRDTSFRFTNGKSSQNYFEFTGSFSTLEMIYISHEWSGKVLVEVDETYSEVINLYSPKHHEKKFRLNKTFSIGQHQVRVRAIEERDNNSRGFEVFFKGFIFTKRIALAIDEEQLRRDYRISVVINTLNRASHLRSLLQELEKQTYPNFEIIVVNGPSTDKTKEVLRPYQDRIKIVDCPEANLSQSRNIGIEHAAGDYIAFIDDDALPCDAKWLENFVYFLIFHSDKKIGIIGGPVKHKNTDHYEFKNGATSDYGFQIFREEELKNRVLDGKRWVQGIPGGNNIASKKALYDIGGFDERFVYYLDETDVCIRLARKGYAIINNPVSYIRHFKAPSNIRKSKYDIGWNIIARSDVFYSLKNGADIFPIRLIKTIRYFRKKHYYQELTTAQKQRLISRSEYKKYRSLLWKGFYEGLKWGIFNKIQKQDLKEKSKPFKSFKQLVLTKTWQA